MRLMVDLKGLSQMSTVNSSNDSGIQQNETSQIEDDELFAPTKSFQEILRNRARSLAKKRTIGTQQQSIEIVEFLMDNDSYAFEPERLREVCTLTYVTHVPCAPAFVAGVINLRGQIITIINIKSFLGLETDSIAVHNKAIIVESGRLCVGFLADEVVGVRKVPMSSLQQGLATLRGLSAEYLKGITRERMVVLDAERILHDPRFSEQKVVGKGLRYGQKK